MHIIQVHTLCIYMTLELIQNLFIYLSIKLDAMVTLYVYMRKFIRSEVVNAFYGCDLLGKSIKFTYDFIIVY